MHLFSPSWGFFSFTSDLSILFPSREENIELFSPLLFFVGAERRWLSGTGTLLRCNSLAILPKLQLQLLQIL